MTNQIITQLNPDVPPTGSDLGIVNAARKSFGRRSEWNWSKELESGTGDGRTLKDKDKRLLEFLARGMTAADFDEFCDRNFWWNFLSDDPEDEQLKSEAIDALWEWRNTPTHDTPFNHGFFSFEVKAPVFVARHLVKHEYLIMSEYSRRYITDDIEFYTPDVWRKAADDVKQGSSADEAVDRIWFQDYGENYEDDIGAVISAKCSSDLMLYDSLIQWTWSGSFGAFANMCKLRLSSDTQAETREVAEAVYEELKKQFPVAAPLLVEGVI
jgi:thymidylate synthase (FAD)